MQDKYRNRLIEQLDSSGGDYDKQRVLSAYDFAFAAHDGQKRASGEPYITHPVEVSVILMSIGLDTDSLVSALLHDTIEDTTVTYDDIKKQFGVEVAEIVDGVTKLGRAEFVSKEDQQVENLRKMFLATAKDVRVIIIKLADRLHNMRTSEYVDSDKQRKKALETMEIYAPIAHRLGIQKIKIELDDLSMRYLDPVGYKEIEDSMKLKEQGHNNFLEHMINQIKKHFSTLGMDNIFVDGRVKHVYSVYRKMYRHNKTLDEIYDLYAVRIIVDTIYECYNALGIIHDMYKPMPGRFKDYISTPKPNRYQSLHTTVIGRDGIPFEVQIRTWDMHRTAEYGIAAHWKYKTNVSGKKGDEQLEWVRQLLKTQADSVDSEDFMRSFKIDFFSDEVFVFTPKGDLINLPAGATVIDFAYAIHSAVGNKMIGAKCNGKMTQLEYQPQNGDILEIITTNSAKGPGRDWVNIAKTTQAKTKIKQWFKKERREENIQKGKEDLERELRENEIFLEKKDVDELLTNIASRNGFADESDLLAALGYGGFSFTKLLPKFKDEYARRVKPSDEDVIAAINEKETKAPKKSKSSVVVEGVDNCLIKFAHCCNPLPGDHIIGYITKGYGVSVHRADCPNVLASLEKGNENDRWLNVSWANKATKEDTFQAALKIVCSKKSGMLADITIAFANMRVAIRNLNAREREDNAEITLSCDVSSTEQLNSIIKRLEGLKGVESVSRGARI